MSSNLKTGDLDGVKPPPPPTIPPRLAGSTQCTGSNPSKPGCRRTLPSSPLNLHRCAALLQTRQAAATHQAPSPQPHSTRATAACPSAARHAARAAGHTRTTTEPPPGGSHRARADPRPACGRSHHRRSSPGHHRRSPSHHRARVDPEPRSRHGDDGSGREDTGSAHPRPGTAGSCRPVQVREHLQAPEKRDWGGRAEGLAAAVLAFLRFAEVQLRRRPGSGGARERFAVGGAEPPRRGRRGGRVRGFFRSRDR